MVDETHREIEQEMVDKRKRWEEYEDKHSAGLYLFDGIYVWAFNGVFIALNHKDYVIRYQECPTETIDFEPKLQRLVTVTEWFEKAQPIYLPSEASTEKEKHDEL